VPRAFLAVVALAALLWHSRDVVHARATRHDRRAQTLSIGAASPALPATAVATVHAADPVATNEESAPRETVRLSVRYHDGTAPNMVFLRIDPARPDGAHAVVSRDPSGRGVFEFRLPRGRYTLQWTLESSEYGCFHYRDPLTLGGSVTIDVGSSQPMFRLKLAAASAIRLVGREWRRGMLPEVRRAGRAWPCQWRDPIDRGPPTLSTCSDTPGFEALVPPDIYEIRFKTKNGDRPHVVSLAPNQTKTFEPEDR